MKSTIAVLLGLGLVTGMVAGPARTALGQQTPKKTGADDPKEILQKVAAALQEVKFVQYDARYTATGWITAHVPNIEGSAALGEPFQYDIARFRAEVKMTPHQSEETIELTAGCDGDLFFLIDPKTKMVYADIDEAVLGTHQRNVQRLLMREFVTKEPLADVLKAEKLELKETVQVGDETCYQIHVPLSDTRGITWFVSKKDWLPRRVDRLYQNPEGGEGSTRLVLTNLVTRTTFSAEPFKVIVPQGFTRTDDFAP